MTKAGITADNRAVVAPAREVEQRTEQPGAAIELPDGTIITGRTSELLGCSSSMLLNALKHLAGIPDEQHLLSPGSIAPIQRLKTKHLGSQNPRLHTDEVLIALSVSAETSPEAEQALTQLKSLRGCDVHVTTILGSVDEQVFRSLGAQVTCDPKFARKTLYQK